MALENIVSNLVLDVYDHDNTPETIKAICGDSKIRYVKAFLTNQGAEYIPSDTATALLYALRPDKTIVVGPAECTTEVTPGETITPIETTITDDDGNEETVYYYVDSDGNTIYVDSADAITLPDTKIFYITAELSEKMLEVAGTVKCQIRIFDGEQVLPTSLFYVKTAINLNAEATCVIDLREA